MFSLKSNPLARLHAGILITIQLDEEVSQICYFGESMEVSEDKSIDYHL